MQRGAQVRVPNTGDCRRVAVGQALAVVASVVVFGLMYTMNFGTSVPAHHGIRIIAVTVSYALVLGAFVGR